MSRGPAVVTPGQRAARSLTGSCGHRAVVTGHMLEQVPEQQRRMGGTKGTRGRG